MSARWHTSAESRWNRGYKIARVKIQGFEFLLGLFYLIMKNIYNITKGQLYTIWIFVVVVNFISFANLDKGEHFLLKLIFQVAFPFLLIFYTIGYSHYQKNNSEK